MNKHYGEMDRRCFLSAATMAAGGIVAGCGSVPPKVVECAEGRLDGEVKFCAFADIHYYPAVFPHDSREWLELILGRAEKEKVDFIIHMGDLTHKPVRYKDYIDFYNDFHVKTYHTLGNHDNDGNTYEETLTAFRLECGHYYFDKCGFRFIVTDTNNCLMDGKFVHYSNANYCAVARENVENVTRVPPEQLEWLKMVIDSSPYPCVVTSHASYEREDGSPDRTEVRRIFNEANAKHPGRVRLVINGHHHCDHVRILDGIVYLDLNSANYNWVDKAHAAYPESDVRRWKLARHVIAWNDPVCAIITINHNGYLKVDGQQSTFYLGVTPEIAGISSANGHQCRPITPNVQSFEMTMAYHCDVVA